MKSSAASSLSVRSFCRMLGFSVGSGQGMIMSLSAKKCRQIADENREGWIMLDDDDIRTQYVDELLDGLEI